MQPKTVAVFGGSYGGYRAAKLLAHGLPEGWRAVLVDRNSHFNHVYSLPRFAVLPGHEHKAFIPYDPVFDKSQLLSAPSPASSTSSLAGHNNIRLHANITEMGPDHVHLNRSFPEHGLDTKLNFDYAIYALGAHLPAPIDLWGPIEEHAGKDIPASPPMSYSGMKTDSVSWLQKAQKRVERAHNILVVGGGALGIQFASDIAHLHPNKTVTLLHSRRQLLPRFDPSLHDEVLQSLENLGVDVMLGERLDMQSVFAPPVASKPGELPVRMVRTQSGREIQTDLLLLCTGQIPNTGLLAAMDPDTVLSDSKMARVLPTMQLDTSPFGVDGEAGGPVDDEEEGVMETETRYPHIFAIGDCADAFGAINAGHTAYYQGEVAARNILRLVRRREGLSSGDDESDEDALEAYAPGAPAIKVSLGLTRAVYEVDGVVGVKDDGADDLNAAIMWSSMGFKNPTEEDMLR